jgi:Asp-tRNA(Asn)/Glu-tRNA(Gln) amidotransferase A subunit family amidase
MQKRAAYSGRMERVLESVDILLAPTLPVVAPRIDAEQVRAGRARRDVRLALLSLTRPANLSGLPALSVPCGFSRGGIPVGLQLIGRRRKEGTLFRAAYAYEQATSWHLQFPPDPV